MELHEEIRRARKDLDLTQGQLAALAGIQRRQLSTLENGGNVTLNTLRRVLAVLPNLQEFTFERIRMKPEYVDMPPLDTAGLENAAEEIAEFVRKVQTFLKSWDPEAEARKARKAAREAAGEQSPAPRRKAAKRRRSAGPGAK